MALEWLIGGSALVGAAAGGMVARVLARRGGDHSPTAVSKILLAHFKSIPLDEITIATRKFPLRVRADLQKGVDRALGQQVTIHYFCGLRKEYSHEGATLADCLAASNHNPVKSVPPEYEPIDIGADEPVSALKCGLWLLERDQIRFALLLTRAQQFGMENGVEFQLAVPNRPEGTRIAQDFYARLEDAVVKADSYRGKILSLESPENSYSGAASGIQVHKLRAVAREEVILPRATLELLDRNVIEFARRRPELARYRMSTRKGLLFYGPPGTGKTHTIHYLAHALPGHTTLLITAGQVGQLAEYMTLARLLEPTIVVIEDVDLIGRDRGDMDVCEEVLLNRLLNEMDGLTEEAAILFLLTTNRPESLERALASRPGRVDQAIEFPLPDAEGRAKLVRLYSRGARMNDEVAAAIVRRTQNVSAAFIKELLRRSVQFQLERDGNADASLASIEMVDVENALGEMLFRGGSLNLKLLGAEGADGDPNEIAG